jgi:iron complex outermembrane recepter protein
MKSTNLLSAVLLRGVSLTVIALTPIGLASAQETPQGTNAQDRDVVVVTATRTSEDIQDVPLAVNVMSSEVLEDLRIQSVGDVLAYTPGAQSFGDDPSNQQVFIRGVGSDILGASSDPAVVTMVDGAVISRTWMRPGAIFDLNRVEVARGPQGTTFGRNATAGVIQFISNRPEFENSGSASIDIGNYDLMEAQFTVNREFSETVAGRLSAYSMQRDGYFTDETDPENTLGDRTTLAVRGQLLFELSDSIDVLLRGAYSDEHIDEATLAQITDPSRPVNYPFFGAFLPRDTDPLTVQTTEQRWDRRLWNVGAEVSFEQGDLTWTWTTDYAQGELPSYTHPWGVPFLAYKAIANEEATVLQTEVRLDNAAQDSPFQWIAGLYALNEDITRQEEKEIMVGTPLQAYHDFVQKNETNSFGVFANGQYEFATGTTISAGVRYSSDEKDYQVPFMSCSNQPNPNGLNPVPGGPGSGICNAFLLEFRTGVTYISGRNSASWDDTSYRVSVSQAIGEDFNLYASYATAYKGGGFPNEPNSGRPEAFIPYDPEVVATTEIGAKGALLEGALNFELAAFDSVYDDRQSESVLPGVGTNVVFNIESASISGLEGQVSWDLTDSFNVTGNFTLLDHEDDTTGEPLTGLMDWTWFLAAGYDHAIGDGSRIRFAADVRSRADRLTGDIPPLTVPEETLYGASATWYAADDNLSVSLWGRNLTDELDVQQLSARTILGSQGTLTAGSPRTYGVTLRTDF